MKCVANYASVHYENAKTDMIKPRVIRVIADSLPDIIHAEMDGFEELKQCIEGMEKPEDSEKALIGIMPILFGNKNGQNLAHKFIKYLPINSENMDECIINEDNQKKEMTGSSLALINCIDIHKMKQNPKINRILQKHLIPTKKINDQIGKCVAKVYRFVHIFIILRKFIFRDGWLHIGERNLDL